MNYAPPPPPPPPPPPAPQMMMGYAPNPMIDHQSGGPHGLKRQRDG